MSASFLPLISKPTRVAGQSATLINNIFCNFIPIPESGIILSDISDHYPIFAKIPLKITSKNGNLHKKRRKVTAENLTILPNSLKDIDWSFVYSTQNVDLSFEYFMNTINSELHTHIPLRRVKYNYKRIPKLPWISTSLLRSINRKNNLFYKWKTKPTELNRQKNVSYKNTQTKILRIQKKILLFY